MQALFTTDPSTLTADQIADRMHLAFTLSTIGMFVAAFHGADASVTPSLILNALAFGLLLAGALMMRALARGAAPRRLFLLAVGMLALLTIPQIAAIFGVLPPQAGSGYLALLLVVPMTFSAGTSRLCRERGLERSAESWRTLTTLFAWIMAGTMLITLVGDGPWSVADLPILLSDVIVPLFFTVFAIGALLMPFLVPWAAFRTVQAQREQQLGASSPPMPHSTRA